MAQPALAPDPRNLRYKKARRLPGFFVWDGPVARLPSRGSAFPGLNADTFHVQDHFYGL